MRWKDVLGIGVAAAVVTTCSLWLVDWVHENTCYDLLPVYETADLQSREARELTHALDGVYASDQVALPGGEQFDPLPLSQPIRVTSVSGKTATVLLAGPSSEVNFLYADAWSSVWGRHHGMSPSKSPMPCVNLNERWKGGGITLMPYPAMY